MSDLVTFIRNKSLARKKLLSAEKSLKQMMFELSGLEEENRMLQQILLSSSEPILITTPDGLITYVNPAWEKLTGYKISEVEGKNPSILASGRTPKKVYKDMWRALIAGKAFDTESIINKKKNGNEYSIHTTIYPVLRNGKTSFYVQLQHDISEKKKLEELRKEFLSVSAHELKTPLTVLKLLTQSHITRAKKKGIDILQLSELELIDNEIDRLVRLINDILDSNRFETGKQFMTFEQTDLCTLVKKTVDKILIYAKNHKIIILDTPDEALVIADTSRIEQVLINLLSNAVKYSPENTTIHVRIFKETNKYVVAISDEGIGIPKKNLKLIFDKYYQVKTKSKNGFGLGLYISKEIIKLHKGKIWVESTRGKGSTFYFSLPAI